jgi:oligosaccharyltransferase complex subunit beta
MTDGMKPHTPLSPHKRILALLDEAELKTSSAKFFNGLSRRGHKISYVKFKEGMNLALKTPGGEWEFDNVIIMSANKVAPSDKTLVNLLEFIDDGGNLLLATSSKASNWMRDLGSELGVTFGNQDVLDRFLPSSRGVIVCSWPTHSNYSTRVVGEAKAATNTVRFSGTTVTPTEAALSMGAISLLLGPGTSFEPQSNVKSGTSHIFITSLQMRNNARVTVVGGTYLFRDEADNEMFTSRLSEWTFGERSVIRTKRIDHRLADGRLPEKQLKRPYPINPLPASTFPDPDWDPESIIYREKDDVVFTLEMEELFTSPDGLQTWKPFNANDMQVEFVMLDPYQRITLTSNGKGVMSGRFQIPDQYGVFKFRVKYTRPGLSTIFISIPASVRPFRHNEYDRFIMAASPYYVSVASVITAFFIFLSAFIYAKN